LLRASAKLRPVNVFIEESPERMLIRHLPNIASRALTSFAFALACTVSAFAQAQQSPSAPVTTTAPAPQTNREADANADLSITARVTARELRFEKVPNPTVEFTGRPRRDTVWEADRENLPAQVRPGETYRNIGITLRITSVFADIERIVAEALGEVPVTEDAPPPRPLSPAPSPATNRTTEPRRPQTRVGRGQ
jgi:hypothetical protein